MDLVEVLGFVFMLSTMELARVSSPPILQKPVINSSSFQEYTTENLSGTQKAMLEDLRDYGLIWQRKVCSWNSPPSYCFLVLHQAHVTAFQPHPSCHYPDLLFFPASYIHDQ
jgi:hypothetical protein